MKKHKYRITVEHLSDADGAASSYNTSLQFNVENHDEIFSIVERMRVRGDFDGDSAAAFGVGLKLFSEVMLENKEHPLFIVFKPHFMEFMNELKKGSRKN